MDSAVHIPEEIYQAGDLRIDVGRHQVMRDGAQIPLPNLSFELLLALTRAHPRMLTTEELLDTVWAPVVVNPETVGQRVKLLRQALGDEARAPRYIVGVRGRGYRLEVPVTRLEQGSMHLPSALGAASTGAGTSPPMDSLRPNSSSGSTGSAGSPALPPPSGSALRRVVRPMVFLAVALALVASGVLWRVAVKAPVADSQQETNQAAGAPTQPPPGQDSVSLAVLPFVDLSPQRDQQYFSDGLAEELLNQLAQLPTLRVIGRTSSFAFRGRSDDLRKIGRALNVNHVLEGSVRKDGDRIRVAVQLIDAMDGSNVWSHTYERTLDDIFAIQEDIGRAVAAELRVRIDDRSAGRGETRNYAAFDEFLTARALLNSNVVSTARAAVSHLEQAVAFDPGYLNAWLWLIDSYTRQAVGDAERRADMKAAQQRAIEKVSALAPQSVYAAIADSYGALSNGQLEIAGKLLESTLDAPPGIRARVGLRYGQFLVSVGRTTAAVDQLMRTRAADPFDVFTRMQTILALEVSGQHDRADAEAAELLQLPGGDAEVLRGDRIARAMDRGDAKALKALLAAGNTGVGQGGGVSVVVLGDPQSARRELERTLNDPHSRLDVFAVTGAMDWAAFLGDSDLALRAAHQAVKLGVSVETWSWSLWRPVMKGVRGQPGFKAVVQEMGLVDYWRATGNWGDFCRPLANNDFECT